MKTEMSKKCKDGRLITLRPIKGGDYDIIVAGEAWGMVMRWQHGQRGSSYTFIQNGAAQIYIKRDAPTHAKPQPAKVLGDKMERYRMRSSEEPAPLEERLMAYTVKLIDDGYLRHPTAIVQDRRAAAMIAQERAQQQNAAQEKLFEDRARQAYSAACAHQSDDKAIAEIVDAMLWAQTQ